ncbi:MAG: deoxyribose-phosphate aldolase [Deinococcales bacterium]
MNTEARPDLWLERNAGMAFDQTWLDFRINKSALERRAATIGTRRTVKKEYQAAWLLRALSCIDLTTLSGDDTETNVVRLCQKAMRPVRQDILETLGVLELGITTGAVCVYHPFVKTAVKTLAGSGVPVAAVSTAFPTGLAPMKTRLEEVRASVGDGAAEIDMVITRGLALGNKWEALFDEVRQVREACGEARLKVILGTGELGSLTNVAKASMVAMMAGADFIKTSTGKESVNATLPVTLVMVRQIRSYLERTGYRVGYKPAGGIRSAKNALEYMFVMRDELGLPWCEAHLFRFGASGLLTDIERQLEHFVTGRYSSAKRHPMP